MSDVMPETISSGKKQTRAFALSLTAGVLILANATAVAAAATWFPDIFPTIPGTSGVDTATLYNIAAVGMTCGAMVALGAMMLRIKPAHKRAWGVLIIAFSIPSVITGGGFIVGFIIGIVGGAMALSRKPWVRLPNETCSHRISEKTPK